MNQFFICMLLCAYCCISLARQLPVQVKQTNQQVKAIPLKDVRLLESPFKHAMDKDGQWLLSLSPDRFLHRFRLNAGLAPKGEIYGGWESRGVSGHSLGHYLSACGLMYAASGDVAFKEKVDYIVAQLAVCQEARKTGYVGGIPDEDKIWNEVASGDIRSQGFDLNGGWVPWYTEHKVLAGLIDAYRYTASEKALRVALKFADWIDDKFKNLSEGQFQKMLDCEHGGMNESLADLYAYTGNKKYLDLSFRFYHKKILDPLAGGRDELAGKHANTQVPKAVGAAKQYALSGDEKSKRISEYFWDEVVHHHTYVIGGNSDFEHFGPPDSLSQRLSMNTTETCNSYNMLKLSRALFFRNPKPAYMDYYERTLYNHILASQNPADGMTCYYVPLVSGGEKIYGTPDESFWCCTGTGMENHVKYGESIFFEGLDGSLYVNLFIPSRLSWSSNGAKIKMETGFPEAQQVKIKIERVGKKQRFPIRVRYPKWTDGMLVQVNGTSIPVTKGTDHYIALDRKWETGDEITLILPMQLYQEAMPDNESKIALLYGPLVLAGELGKNNIDPTNIPLFVGKSKAVSTWVKPVDQNTLRFEAVAYDQQQVSLIPFYQMHHQKYAVYWDSFTEEKWEERKIAFEEERLRIADEKRRTVDELRIGEMQPERDHHVESTNSNTGELMGRKWRDAHNGWFAFDMKVEENIPMSLVCNYFGSDNGREFDILVDGEKIATQTLRAQQPNKFFEVSYAIPAHLLKNKQVVRVKFQAGANQIAGRLFGCKMLQNEDVKSQ